MREIDPGHLYELDTLDSGYGRGEILRFVKRVGDKFPGNEPPAYSGTTTQEVLRALIARTKYVDGQRHFDENDDVIEHLRAALWLLEWRAHRVRDSRLPLWRPHEVEHAPTCITCGHITCREDHK